MWSGGRFFLAHAQGDLGDSSIYRPGRGEPGSGWRLGLNPTDDRCGAFGKARGRRLQQRVQEGPRRQ